MPESTSRPAPQPGVPHAPRPGPAPAVVQTGSAPAARQSVAAPIAQLPRHAPLAVVLRADTVESVHSGSVAVVDRDGRLLYGAGDPHAVTYTRSALKPLQALPFVAAGGPERFGFGQAQLALMCASHSGEARHVEAAADMLARAGNTADDLQCGTHVPLQFEAQKRLPPPPPWSPLAHNCSGKHAGMLAHCTLCGWHKGDYVAADHPLQQAIRRAVARYTGTPEHALALGIDGCSAPNYALPLAGLAHAYARLASGFQDPEFGAAGERLAAAMSAHPEMVSGEGRSDLVLARASRGDWLAKIGAEGVQAVGVRSRGWGIAVKAGDGGARGLLPAVVSVLDQLGLLDLAARAELGALGRPVHRNYRGLQTGETRPVVVLDKYQDAGSDE